MRRLAFLVILLSALALSADAEAQFTAAWIPSPSPNSEFTLMGGIMLPLWQPGRFSVGPGFMGGMVFDQADPGFRGDTHAHFTWGPAVQATYYFTDSVGITGGYLWGFVPKSAKNHLDNYRSPYVGVSLKF